MALSRDELLRVANVAEPYLPFAVQRDMFGENVTRSWGQLRVLLSSMIEYYTQGEESLDIEPDDRVVTCFQHMEDYRAIGNKKFQEWSDGVVAYLVGVYEV